MYQFEMNRDPGPLSGPLAFGDQSLVTLMNVPAVAQTRRLHGVKQG
jgi:hypothetical protein